MASTSRTSFFLAPGPPPTSRHPPTAAPCIAFAPALPPRFAAPLAPRTLSRPVPPIASRDPADPTASRATPDVVAPSRVPLVAPPVSAPLHPSSREKWVYAFGGGHADGDGSMKSELGGKGAALAEMSSLGLPVPPGFTLQTAVCAHFADTAGQFPRGLRPQVQAALATLEASTGKGFGHAERPLLLSVRSGARASMPGMMDTVLNLGLNDSTVAALANHAGGDERFAYDCYRRFIQMFANIVLGVDMAHFERALAARKAEAAVDSDADLSPAALRALITDYKELVLQHTGAVFQQDVYSQLWQAIAAVFKSWENERAATYRRLNGIPHAWGTAVNVQAMVFGNAGRDSLTGVAFTRDPSTGENQLFGEYLENAQGEDVVSGSRTPQPITRAAARALGLNEALSMEAAHPRLFSQLVAVRGRLEGHFRDLQDVEFTAEHGTLYLLQTRSAKRSPRAAVRVAVELVDEGVLSKEDALLRVEPRAARDLLHATLDSSAARIEPLATGLPAAPGAAAGRVMLSSAAAVAAATGGTGADPVLLVRDETSPDDVAGMHAASGVLTARGGMTSHAAVVARGMGRPCVVGCAAIAIDEERRVAVVAGVEVREGDWLTIDGASGAVLPGCVPTVPADGGPDFERLLRWADDARTLTVLANAETPTDVRNAVRLGAQGIGLCRTEHMFFDERRIVAVRQTILADEPAVRDAGLRELLPMQQADFAELFRLMLGKPVTIRLLDPPLHEFLPTKAAEFEEVAAAAGTPVDVVRGAAERLREQNPMLGLRGCRLGILKPELYEMQVRAALRAAAAVACDTGTAVRADLMVPFVSCEAELRVVREQIDDIAAEELSAELHDESVSRLVSYSVGTMIELPRAALNAGGIARHAAFFSFGTNDLTQTTFGLSRDDAATLLLEYQRTGVLPADPFVSLDVDGVGELVCIAAERGRATREDLKLCLCGEQGGDAATVDFCHAIGLHAVSVSPFGVPVARLAAAQAAIKTKRALL